MFEIPEADQIKPGQLYEDCRYHPMLCIKADYDEDSLLGISLVDGSYGYCSPRHCGVWRMTIEEATKSRLLGPQSVQPESEPLWDEKEMKNKWWDEHTIKTYENEFKNS